MFKFLVLFCFLGVAFAAPAPADQQANVDLCGQQLFLIGDRNKQALPVNLEQMEGHCTVLENAQSCISNYSDSYLDGMAKQVTSLLVKGSISPVNDQCHSEANRNIFLSHTRCFNHDLQSLHSCMEGYIDNLQALSNAPKDSKVPLTCCNYYNFRKCILDKLTANGGDICSQNSIDYMRIMLDGYASEVLGLLCKHTPPESETCTNMSLPDKPTDMVRTKSILPPFIQAFESF